MIRARHVVAAALVLAACGCESPADRTTVSEDPEAIAAASAASPDPGEAFAAEPVDPKRAVSAAVSSEAPSTPAPKEPPRAHPVEPRSPEKRPVAPKQAKTAPEPEPKIAPKRGPAASSPTFSTWLQTTGGYEVGKSGVVVAVLTAKAPYKCNDKYPYKLVLDPAPNGVTYSTLKVRGMRIAEKRSTLHVPFTPTKAGRAKISGTLSFSVCTKERCLVEKRALSVNVEAQ